MKSLISLLALFTWTSYILAGDKPEYYNKGLCNNEQYDCIKLKRSGTWKRLFPNEHQRDLIQRINRTDTYLYRGRMLAIPKNIDSLTIYDVSPMPLRIKANGEKTIIVDQAKLAWAAYDYEGRLVKWGPISSGKDYCRDVGRACNTKPGIFYIFAKKDRRCKSNIFPVGEGGARMPYCMFFYRGYALHGSHEVLGRRDSHGCVRLFTRDAKWLNEVFVDMPSEYNNFQRTRIIVQDISAPKTKKRKKS